MCQRAKLTYPTTANSGPTHQNSGGKLSQGLGPLPVLKTFWDKEPFSRPGGIQKRTGDCPVGRASELGDRSFRFRRSASVMGTVNRRAHFQDFSSVWFIVSGQSLIEFSPVSSASLKISSRVSTLGTRSVQTF